MTTSNTTPRLAASVLGIWLLATGCDAATRNNSKVDKLFAQWNRTDSPGAAVVIVKDGAVVYQHGYGCANLEHHIPITPQTPFDVASVAKQFTGMSVAMLVQQGSLPLDDDIRKHVPDVPDFGKPITISNLLHHTSGLRDWPATLALAGLDWEGPITLDTILEMVRRQRELDFSPGEEFLYSNTGYNLLAAAVAKATGQSFRAWTDANLFQPLGMNHSLVRDNLDEIVANSADSYSPDDRGEFHRAKSQLSAQGSSSLFTTAEDMGKWLLNFETGRVGGKTTVEMMLQPGKLNSGARVDYGFGLALGDYQGSPMIHHEGSWAGYRSLVMRIPERRFAVAILSNAGNADVYGLGLKIANLYLGTAPAKPAGQPPAKPVAAAKSDPAIWDRFLGTYRLGPGWLLTITREGDQLLAQATHESKFKMTPISDRTFFVEAYGAAVEFVRNDSGFVTNLLYRGINAPKFIVPDSTPAYLAAYVGDYWSEELRVTAHVEIHDGRLAVQLRSGEWMRLLPTEPDHFDTEGAGWCLKFTRNAASEVTEANVSGGRIRHFRYTRVTLSKSAPSTGLALAELRVDKAAAEFKVSGEGVLVAIMDRGIDWENDDFRNDDGTTRIQAIFDLTDDAGANSPANPYKMGTIYTRVQIDQALKGGQKLPVRDAVGHGTTSAAIACGSGRHSPGLAYRGVAPQASILIVKLVSDGTPAHDGEPAEPAFFKFERIPTAIDFVRDKAKELKKPCVMVLNIGSQGGPTDGTSELCRKIDATVGPNKPGLIFVTGPGDDGGRPNRAGGMIKQGELVSLKVRKEAATPIHLDLWYSEGDRLDVSVQTPDATFGPFPSPTDADQRISESGKGFVYHHNTGNARFWNPSNSKREVWIELKGSPGDYAIALKGASVRNGRFDATLGPTPPAPTWPPFDGFRSHVAAGSIWDGATARNNICPGDYVVQTEWTDIDGRPQSHTNEGNVGDLWKGSSVGPTFDGRKGIDFCMPGDSVFTTYNPKSMWATVRSNLIQDGKGLYGRASAVSAANPMTAGVIALMLQLDPTLDAAKTKKILQLSSRSDNFTGKTPNPTWGYGKLDAYEAVRLTRQSIGTQLP